MLCQQATLIVGGCASMDALFGNRDLVLAGLQTRSPHLTIPFCLSSTFVKRNKIGIKNFSVSSFSQNSVPFEKVAKPHKGTYPALKEWAPIVSALEDGSQTIVVRKGGIREPLFVPREKTFLLFPTSFHTNLELLSPEAQERYNHDVTFDVKDFSDLEFRCLAEVTGVWTTYDPCVLEATSEFHVYGKGFLDKRLRWRADQPLTLMELRLWQLKESALRIKNAESFYGCFSWLDIPVESVDEISFGKAVVDDSEFARRQVACRRCLAQLKDVKELGNYEIKG